MYYIWSISRDYPNKYWLKYDFEKNPDYLDFMENKKLNLINPLIFYLDKNASVEKFKKYDFIQSDGPVLFSEKLAEIIKNIASFDIQLIKSELYCNNKLVDNYYVPNVLYALDCIDKKRSVVEDEDEDEDDITYTTVAIKSGSLGEHMLVQAKGLGWRNFVVKKEVVEVCKNAKIKGIDFCKEPYTNPIYL